MIFHTSISLQNKSIISFYWLNKKIMNEKSKITKATITKNKNPSTYTNCTWEKLKKENNNNKKLKQPEHSWSNKYKQINKTSTGVQAAPVGFSVCLFSPCWHWFPLGFSHNPKIYRTCELQTVSECEYECLCDCYLCDGLATCPGCFPAYDSGKSLASPWP